MPRRYPVAEKIVTLHHHLALMHADAQADPVGLTPQLLLHAIAHRNAWTALAKPARKPSPVVLKSRPPFAAASGSMMSVRSVRTRDRVAGSSAPTMAE